MFRHIGLVCTTSPNRFKLIGPSRRFSIGQVGSCGLGVAVTSSGALNGTVVVRPCITAVAVPVAVSTPFTRATLVIVGIMLMLVGFGTATACGSPLVIDSTAIATMAETILFFVLIIVSPLFDFRFIV